MPASARARAALAVPAFLVGLSIPTIVSGRAIMQSVLAVAFLSGVWIYRSDPAFRDCIKRAIRSPWSALLAVMFVAWLPSILQSWIPAQSWSVWARMIAGCLALLVLWGALNNADRTRRLALDTLAVAALILFGWTALALVTFPELQGLIRPSLLMRFPEFGAAENLYWVAQTQKLSANAAAVLVPAIAYWGWRRGSGWRWSGPGYLLVAIAILVVTESRSAMAGLAGGGAIALVALAAHHRRARWWLMALLLVCAVAGLAAVRWLDWGSHDGPENYLPTWLIDPHRQAIWKFALSAFLDRPWFGWGINTINAIPGAEANAAGLTVAVLPSHPHNVFVEVLAETGIVGFLPFLGVVAATLLIPLAGYARNGNALDLTLITQTSIFWASAQFNFSFWSLWWQLTMAVVMLIVMAQKNMSPTTPLR